MRALYFAYGSNMDPDQLRTRVPAAHAHGCARLEGWRLLCNKLGRDRSAKANLVRSPGVSVWGVLYELETPHLELLDRFEAGYARVLQEVCTEVEQRFTAHVYVSERLTDDPVPFDWYKQRMLRGARAHGLPQEWVRGLEALPSRPDPRRGAR